MPNTRKRKSAICSHGGLAKGFEVCKKCYRQIYYENHLELERGRAKQWQRDHAEQHNLYNRRWRAKQKEKFLG